MCVAMVMNIRQSYEYMLFSSIFNNDINFILTVGIMATCRGNWSTRRNPPTLLNCIREYKNKTPLSWICTNTNVDIYFTAHCAFLE